MDDLDDLLDGVDTAAETQKEPCGDDLTKRAKALEAAHKKAEQEVVRLKAQVEAQTQRADEAAAAHKAKFGRSPEESASALAAERKALAEKVKKLEGAVEAKC